MYPVVRKLREDVQHHNHYLKKTTQESFSCPGLGFMLIIQILHPCDIYIYMKNTSDRTI